MSLERGLIQVYTGNGKGKTTAALGLALRAVGRGLKVCMIQFIKGGAPTASISPRPATFPGSSSTRPGATAGFTATDSIPRMSASPARPWSWHGRPSSAGSTIW